MIPQTIKDEISSLSKEGVSFKPHRYLALLAAIRVYKNDKLKTRRIYYNEEFKDAFNSFFKKYSSDGDRNRPYTPFFHLKNTSFWELIPVSGKEDILAATDTIGGPGMLLELVQYAELDASFCELLDDEQDYEDIESLLIKCLTNGSSVDNYKSQDKSNIFERLSFSPVNADTPNPFVAYLNSLHCRDAGSENALAESQACSPWFGHIEVPHPLLPSICNCLLGSEPHHVIITGHAGDGKSIIALELYKNLKNLEPHKPLVQPLEPRENISLPNGIEITIIKDLSEWGDEQRLELFSEILSGNRRFLLVSNTGTLLDSLCNYGSHRLELPRAETEPNILEAISSQQFYPLKFGKSQFDVINLALLDNLSIAQQVFNRMLAPDRWIACQDKECHNDCPIYRNVSLIQEYQDIVLTRLFLAYRRMYEYGTRLTLRQLIAHLAYILTSGLEYADILHLSARPEEPLMSEFMFYNRFFGDNGKEDDLPALQMRAVKEIRKQGFGERPCPTWERQLWLLTQAKHFTLGIPPIEKEFDELRKYGSGDSNIEDDQLTQDQARDQVRRMLFFLYRFPEHDDLFMKQFLSSPAVIKWWGWQSDNARLSLDESGSFKQRVFHVLQEQFTGVRLPESNSADQNLYITLSRHKQEIRQSAQVVLAQIDFGSEFSLELVRSVNDWGEKRNDLCLIGRGRLKGVNMTLRLPFLDYVLMRHCGETGEVLQSAYMERLERLKTQLLKLGDRAQNDNILLVRILTNHTFFRQNYVVHNNRLEVANG